MRIINASVPRSHLSLSVANPITFMSSHHPGGGGGNARCILPVRPQIRAFVVAPKWHYSSIPLRGWRALEHCWRRSDDVVGTERLDRHAVDAIRGRSGGLSNAASV